MALKLLHTADWHLGRRFPAFDRDSEVRLTRARLEVVGRILDLAANRDVDAVLCAGDLFDGPDPDAEWWEGLLGEFRNRPWSRPVILLPGNHDPLTPRSVYSPNHRFREGLPAYVHVVDKAGWELEVGDNAVVLANPCTSHAGQTGLAESLPSREDSDERIRIGLVHGQTFDIEGHQTNFPITRGIGFERGLDYLAIGDTHAYRDVEPDSPVPVVYPSAPEATNFGETDTGQVALVFIPLDRRRRVQVRPERVGSWTWRDVHCRSMAELRAIAAEPNLRKTVLRLKLDMAVPMADYDEAERILIELGGSMAATPRVGVFALDRNGLKLAIDAPIAFDEELPPVLASTVERLKERARHEPELAERALHHLYKLIRETA